MISFYPDDMLSIIHQSILLPVFLQLKQAVVLILVLSHMKHVTSHPISRSQCPPGKYYEEFVNNCEPCVNICNPGHETMDECEDHSEECQTPVGTSLVGGEIISHFLSQCWKL